jgi:hypothetical protein
VEGGNDDAGSVPFDLIFYVLSIIEEDLVALAWDLA